MKYIITENKLNKAIIEYFNETYNVEQIHWVHPYFHIYFTGEEYEDSTETQFYVGDYEGSDTDFLFVYFTKKHFASDEMEYKKAPILTIREKEYDSFMDYFGNMWIEQFKAWFKENFNLSVRTISRGIEYY
jgi:hypothetical protein